MSKIRRLPGFIHNMIKTQRRRTTLPRFLTYTVTFTCNARCIMCDSWKMTSEGDLSIDEISGIFDQLPPMDAIRLTGGEPFVRKDLLEIAHLAQRKLRPFFLHITSNGFLTNRIVEFCEQREKTIPLQLLISLDGVKEKHNYIRGRDTAWDSAMKTIEALAPRRKELRMSIAVNQTIVDADGIEQYRRLREVLRPLGINNNMVMAYDASATYNLEREKEIAPDAIGQFSTFGEFTKEHLKELMAEVERDLEYFPLQERIAKRYYLKGIRNRLLHEHGRPNPKCVALTSHMRLFPNGDVPTCQFSSKTVGNLRAQNFREIWYSQRAEKQRDWVRKCPGCWAECEILPSALYSGDIIKHTAMRR